MVQVGRQKGRARVGPLKGKSLIQRGRHHLLPGQEGLLADFFFFFKESWKSGFFSSRLALSRSVFLFRVVCEICILKCLFLAPVPSFSKWCLGGRKHFRGRRWAQGPQAAPSAVTARMNV